MCWRTSKSVSKTLAETKRRLKGSLPLLDPIRDMHIEDQAFKKLVRVCRTLATCASVAGNSGA
jgi:hypothetical protein